MRQYCTLFDRNYLAKGLVLYESLRWHSSHKFKLHVLAMDDETFLILAKLALPGMELHLLENFEKVMQLADVRAGRTWQEYCWTCASNLLEYLSVSHEQMTYLDADLMFFSDPEVVFNEIDDRSIAITPHRFSAEKRYLERNGIFNVGWVTIKNDEVGLRCVRRWARECRAWCHARNENDKFGDQKYLDHWPRLYGKNLCIIENIGANLAPWNMDQYDVAECDGRVIVDGVQDLVFFHFHEFTGERLTGYKLEENYSRAVYDPYIMRWNNAWKTIIAAELTIVAEYQQIK